MAIIHKPPESTRDCSSGPRVITHQVMVLAEVDEAECHYCGKKAVYDGSRWTHFDTPQGDDEK